MEATREGVESKIDGFAEGDLEHATQVLSALWEIVNKDEDKEDPWPTPSPVSPPRLFLPKRDLSVHFP